VSRSSEKRLRDTLERIAAAKRAERLLDDAEADGDAAAADTAFDAILYDLVVIGEAVKSLPRSMKDLHPEVPWTSIAGMRDVLAHEYFAIRAAVIRDTLDEPLERLRLVCRNLADDDLPGAPGSTSPEAGPRPPGP